MGQDNASLISFNLSVCPLVECIEHTANKHGHVNKTLEQPCIRPPACKDPSDAGNRVSNPLIVTLGKCTHLAVDIDCAGTGGAKSWAPKEGTSIRPRH